MRLGENFDGSRRAAGPGCEARWFVRGRRWEDSPLDVAVRFADAETGLMADDTPPRQTSRLRRLGQALGFVFNDDGTWGPLRLQSARGREAVAKAQAVEQETEAPQVRPGE